MVALIGLFVARLAMCDIAFATPVPIGPTGGREGVSITIPKKGTNNANQVTVHVVTPSGKSLSSLDLTFPGGTDVSGFPSGSSPVVTNDGTVKETIPVSGSDRKVPFTGKNLFDTSVTVTLHYSDGTSTAVSPSVETASASGPPSGLPVITTTGGAVAFNSTTGTLTFSGGLVTGTSFAGDPLLGAGVSVPTYTLLGLSDDGADIIFQDRSNDSGELLMATGGGLVFEADAPFLFYDIANNNFSTGLNMLGVAGAPVGTAFYDNTLAALSSPSLALLNNELNPGGAGFLGDLPLGVSFTPGVNFGSLTRDFSVSGNSSEVGAVFVTTTPEPATIWMVFSSAIIFALVLPSRRYLRPEFS
jgi:hypothetical protein